MLTIRVPAQPPAEISANSRAHHMEKYRINRDLRLMAKIAAMDAINATPHEFPDAPRYHVAVTIAWGKRRKRQDDDNAHIACKSMLDGIADALGVNDRRFDVDVAQRRDPEGIGHVVVRIAPQPEDGS